MRQNTQSVIALLSSKLHNPKRHEHFLMKVYRMLKAQLSLYLTKVPRYEDVWVSESTAPLILNFGTRWRGVVCLTTRPVYPSGKDLPAPLE